MNGISKVFFDTAPIIYFLDNDEKYVEKVRDFIYDAISSTISIITSAITVTEYLTWPYRTGNIEKITVFFEFLNDMGIFIAPIDTLTANKAAQIRAEYQFFKTMDSLQLASACINNCDVFLTNDKQLCQFKELRCITADSLL